MPSSTASTDCGGGVEGSVNLLPKALSVRQHSVCYSLHRQFARSILCVLNDVQSLVALGLAARLQPCLFGSAGCAPNSLLDAKGERIL